MVSPKYLLFFAMWSILVVAGYSAGDGCGDCATCITFSQGAFGVTNGPTFLGWKDKNRASWVPMAFDTSTGNHLYYINSACDDGTAAVNTNPAVSVYPYTLNNVTYTCTVASYQYNYWQEATDGVNPQAQGTMAVTQTKCSAGSS